MLGRLFQRPCRGDLEDFTQVSPRKQLDEEVTPDTPFPGLSLHSEGAEGNHPARLSTSALSDIASAPCTLFASGLPLTFRASSCLPHIFAAGIPCGNPRLLRQQGTAAVSGGQHDPTCRSRRYWLTLPLQPRLHALAGCEPAPAACIYRA